MPSLLPRARSVPATRAFFLFLKLSKPLPSRGPPSWVFALTSSPHKGHPCSPMTRSHSPPSPSLPGPLFLHTPRCALAWLCLGLSLTRTKGARAGSVLPTSLLRCVGTHSYVPCQNLVPELPTAQHPAGPQAGVKVSPLCSGRLRSLGRSGQNCRLHPRLPLSPSHSPLKSSASPGGCALEETEVTHGHVRPFSAGVQPASPYMSLCCFPFSSRSLCCFPFSSRVGLFETNPKCHAPLFPELPSDSPSQNQSQVLPPPPGPRPHLLFFTLRAPLRPHQPPTCPYRFPAPAVLFLE